MKPDIRSAGPADADAIVAIEAATAVSPWPAVRICAACGTGDGAPASTLVAVMEKTC